MIDIKNTLLATIRKTLTKLRYLGQDNPKLFRSILEVCLIQDLIDWADGFSDVPISTQLALRDRQNYIILHNCGFDIKQLADHVYVSANIPMPNNNDFWKLIDFNPAGVVIVNDPKEGNTVLKIWKEDPNYTPIVVEYFADSEGDAGPSSIIKEDGSKLFDEKTATVHDKMNVYVNRKTGTVWYYDTDCTWHAIGKNADATNEATIRNIVEQYKINYSDENGEYILTKLTAEPDEDKVNNKIGLVSVNEINEML